MPNRLPSSKRLTEASTNIDHTVYVDVAFRLVYVRAHFREDHDADSPSNDPAELVISLVSIHGVQYDTTLYTFTNNGGRGIGADANLIVTNEEIVAPSPWSFPADSGLKFTWANPGGVEWGIEVGYEPLGISG